MRGIIFHCRRVWFRDRKKSDRPRGIKDVITAMTEASYAKIVTVMICIEENDTAETVREAAEHVDVHNKHFLNRGHILVCPFVHLSSRIAEPRKAIELLGIFADELERMGYKTSSVTFGTHKDFLLEAFGHLGSVSYFEFPRPV